MRSFGKIQEMTKNQTVLLFFNLYDDKNRDRILSFLVSESRELHEKVFATANLAKDVVINCRETSKITARFFPKGAAVSFRLFTILLGRIPLF